MSVYVGPSLYPYGRMIMCHMVADTNDELHAMARKLEMRPIWFQSYAKYPHYDLSKGKRATAVQLGAIEVDERKIIEVAKRSRDDTDDL